MSDHETEDRQLWSDKAEGWDRQVGSEGDRNRIYNVHPTLFRMLDEVGDLNGKRVLDAGCGTGYLAIKLARQGAKVSAIDYAPGMVAVAKMNVAEAGLDIALRQDSIMTLTTVADQSQDLVVSNYVLQDAADHRAAAQAIHRVLAPGGRAILVFSHPCFDAPGGPMSRKEGGVSYHWSIRYFDEVRCEESWPGVDSDTGEKFRFPGKFTYYHRPLSAYWQAFRAAGFSVIDFDEPTIQPPYPESLDAGRIERYRQCSFSVAFHLRSEG